MWLPKYVASDIISLNQNYIDNINNIIDTIKPFIELLKLCIVKTPELVKVNNTMLVLSGQGEGDTKWKGWAWKLLLFNFRILFYMLSYS